MLSFASSLSPDSEAFAIFVNDRFHFRDKQNVLSKEAIKKIDSYLSILKDKKSEEEISSLDISAKQKCFIIKVKKKYETYYPEEKGGIFYSYLKNFKSIKKIDIYIDSLDHEREEIVNFSSEFIFGFTLKSYTFDIYKTLDKKNSEKNITCKIITSHKDKIEKKYKYNDAIKSGVFLTRDLVSEPGNILHPDGIRKKIGPIKKIG
jgi:Leucyl aminopeptidase